MKFLLNNEDKKALETLFAIHEDNLYAADILNAYLSETHEDDAALVGLYKMKGSKENEALSKVFDQIVHDEEIEDYERIAADYGFHAAKKLDASAYEKTPYYQLLKKVNLQEKDVTLVHPAYYPFEAFLAEETVVDGDGREHMPLGYFDRSFAFPALTKGKRTWMSLIPHEINTMAPAIAKAKGKVATLGLGLGYFAFMVSEKKDVESVDIIEFDPYIISLFKKALLPLFPRKEKIRIIQGDAIKYLKETQTRYDYIYADLWHREDDALPLYIRLRKVAEKKSLPMDYWIERSILAYLRRIVVALINEEYAGANDEDYPDEGNELDKLFASLHHHYKDTNLKTIDDVKALLSEDALRKLVLSL